MNKFNLSPENLEKASSQSDQLANLFAELASNKRELIPSNQNNQQPDDVELSLRAAINRCLNLATKEQAMSISGVQNQLDYQVKESFLGLGIPLENLVSMIQKITAPNQK